MPCLRPDGSLSSSGRAMLAAVRIDTSAAAVSSETGIPLYRVRSALRELAEAGLVNADGELFSRTEKGAAAISRQ
jgi:predicted transcriptional regulator